jgi:hypothetical protein
MNFNDPPTPTPRETFQRDHQFAAILGDLLHKQDCYLIHGDFGPGIEPFFGAHSQAQFLRSYFPLLVPRPEAGQEPSEHRVSTEFEYQYYRNLQLRVFYCRWLREMIAQLKIARDQLFPN